MSPWTAATRSHGGWGGGWGGGGSPSFPPTSPHDEVLQVSTLKIMNVSLVRQMPLHLEDVQLGGTQGNTMLRLLKPVVCTTSFCGIREIVT